jgi:hypothetical protein
MFNTQASYCKQLVRHDITCRGIKEAKTGVISSSVNHLSTLPPAPLLTKERGEVKREL